MDRLPSLFQKRSVSLTEKASVSKSSSVAAEALSTNIHGLPNAAKVPNAASAVAIAKPAQRSASKVRKLRLRTASRACLYASLLIGAPTFLFSLPTAADALVITLIACGFIALFLSEVA